MTILAEGIEKVEQKNILTEYGCDMFQGYYFSKPLCKEDLLSFI
jgi:EAL domain-containing protein (putative c-di-GMP-specific phosphodiesterase class I)